MKLILYPILLMSALVVPGLVSVPHQPRRIGSTETITVVDTGLPFAARVDTGATSCSIHYEDMEIDNPAKDPEENVGKPIRFLVKNKLGQSKWVEAVIVDHVTVRTSERSSSRYKVRLSLCCQDVRKDVLVTLNNRQKMRYPVLIGRNFLKEDFVVAVD